MPKTGLLSIYKKMSFMSNLSNKAKIKLTMLSPVHLTLFVLNALSTFSLELGVANVSSCVGRQNEKGHLSPCHKQLMQVVML